MYIFSCCPISVYTYIFVACYDLASLSCVGPSANMLLAFDGRFFFIKISLYAYVVYELHILIVCRGGHISGLYLILHSMSDNLTIVKTSPLVCFLLSNKLTIGNIHLNMCYYINNPSQITNIT